MGRREELIKEIEGLRCPDGDIGLDSIADFILQRESALLKKIKEPLKSVVSKLLLTPIESKQEHFDVAEEIDKLLAIIQTTRGQS